jgi:hypothetical protein
MQPKMLLITHVE